MKPFYCRVGSKRKFSEALIKLFPEHEKYVEAFFGGGAVFFEKEPSKTEIINDLDSKLIRDYRLLQKAPTDVSKYPIITSESGQNNFLKQKHSSVPDRIVEALFRRCNGFGGKYIEEGSNPKVFTHWNRTRKNTTHETKLKNIAEYKRRINQATLTEEPYESVLRKHDGANTFFFLDPPYEKSDNLNYAKGSESFDFQKFHDEVAKLKGKFLITINDSPRIRKIFKNFNIYKYVVKGHHSPTSNIGAKDRKELLITNYPLEKNWKKVLKGGVRTHKENVLEKYDLEDEGYSVEELAEITGIPKATLQEVYNRGIGAHRTSPKSVRMKGTFKKGVDAPMSEKLSKEQWAMARLYSFIDGNPKHDQDLRGGAKGIENEDYAVKLYTLVHGEATRIAQQYNLNIGSICSLTATMTIEVYLQYFNDALTIQIVKELEKNVNQANKGITTTDLEKVFQNAGFKTYTWKPSPNPFEKMVNNEPVYKTNNQDPDLLKTLNIAKRVGHPVLVIVPGHVFTIIPGVKNGRTIFYDFDCVSGPRYNTTQTQIIDVNEFNLSTYPTILGLLTISSERVTEEDVTEVINPIQSFKIELQSAMSQYMNNPDKYLFVENINQILDSNETQIYNLLQVQNKQAFKNIIQTLRNFIASNSTSSSGLNNADATSFFNEVLSLAGLLNREWLYYTKKETVYDRLESDHSLILQLLDSMEDLNQRMAGISIDLDANNITYDQFLEGIAALRGEFYQLLNSDFNIPVFFEQFVKDLGIEESVVKVENTGFTITEKFPEILELMFGFGQWLEQKSQEFLKEIQALEGGPSHIPNSNAGTNTNTGLGKYKSLMTRKEYNSLKDLMEGDIKDLEGKTDEESKKQLENAKFFLEKIKENPEEFVEEWGRLKNKKRWNIFDLFGSGKTAFENKLYTLMFNPEQYMKVIRIKAKQHGYEPSSISFSDDKSHKLQIKTPDGKVVRFGRTGYGDHLIWTYLESKGEAPKGMAEQKQKIFHASHSKIKGNWRKNKYSPNNLALNLLW